MKIKKVFLDINVIVDLIDVKRDNHLDSIELMKYLIINDCEICISEDMITTIYYILKDKENSLNFLANVVFIDWSILTFGKDVLKKAVHISSQMKVDLEDTLQCLCAKENGCEAFITNDRKFYNCGIKIYTTKEFLNKATSSL